MIEMSFFMCASGRYEAQPGATSFPVFSSVYPATVRPPVPAAGAPVARRRRRHCRATPRVPTRCTASKLTIALR